MGVVIYGPPATGKTFHKDRFKRLYNARRIVDGSGVDHPIKFRNGDLILTNDPIEWARQRFPGMRLVSIGEARKAAGLGPAPKGGFRR
ncbi:hypothetical protein [Sphingomonas sp.]|uniref:hypothetical protein n=1 Tax=Sphingomonas sp. TaxID=28214 RepID=UPI00257EEBA1|nr:hypothetical protein [Sphingomonas sp.]